MQPGAFPRGQQSRSGSQGRVGTAKAFGVFRFKLGAQKLAQECQPRRASDDERRLAWQPTLQLRGEFSKCQVQVCPRRRRQCFPRCITRESRGIEVQGGVHDQRPF